MPALERLSFSLTPGVHEIPDGGDGLSVVLVVRSAEVLQLGGAGLQLSEVGGDGGDAGTGAPQFLPHAQVDAWLVSQLTGEHSQASERSNLAVITAGLSGLLNQRFHQSEQISGLPDHN